MGLEDFAAAGAGVGDALGAGVVGISATVGSAAAMVAPHVEQNFMPSSIVVPQAEQNWAINPPSELVLAQEGTRHRNAKGRTHTMMSGEYH